MLGNNTAIGRSALAAVTTGNQNVAVGALTSSGLTTGTQNVAVGYNAAHSAVGVSNEIVIGSGGTGRGPDTVTFGSGTNFLTYALNNSVQSVSFTQVGGSISVSGATGNTTSNAWVNVASIASLPRGTYIASAVISGTAAGPGFVIFSTTSGPTAFPTPIPPSTTMVITPTTATISGPAVGPVVTEYGVPVTTVINTTASSTTVYLVYGGTNTVNDLVGTMNLTRIG